MESAHSKILLISDMPSKAIAYNQMLKGLGYDPVVAFSISRALALLRNNDFKVIVLEQNNSKNKTSIDYQHLMDFSSKASIKICILGKATSDEGLPEAKNSMVIHTENQQAIAAELDRILG